MLGVFAASGLGGHAAPDVLRQARPGVALPVHEVSARGAAASTATASTSRRVRVRYFETMSPVEVPPGSSTSPGTFNGIVTCPRGQKAVSGYFSSNAGVTEGLSAVAVNGAGQAVPREWAHGLWNIGSAAQPATLGVVCLAGVR